MYPTLAKSSNSSDGTPPPPISIAPGLALVAEPSQPSHASVDDLVDARLAIIFHQVQRLARKLNDRATKGAPAVTESEAHQGLIAAQYGLFRLQGQLAEPLEECLRLAMLATLTTFFQVVGSRIAYKHATDRLREQCLAVEITTPRVGDVMFWILMMGGMAFFDWEEPWLVERLHRTTSSLHWNDARRHLRRFIWIDIVHDRQAQPLFDRVFGASTSALPSVAPGMYMTAMT
jgi:hypothetical protein